MNAPLNTQRMAGRRRGPLPAPLHRPGLAGKGSRMITRADNIYLWDSDGHKMLDAMSGLWCVNVGYGQQELADAATRQMRRCPSTTASSRPPRHRPSNWPKLLAAGDAAAVPARVLQRLGLGGQRHQRAHGAPLLGPAGPAAAQGHHQPHNAYHGSTMAGASLGGMSGMHAQGGLPIPGITHIEPALLVLNWPARRDRGRLRPRRRLAGGQDPGTGRRQGGRLHRRAGAGRGRRDHSAGHLLARDPAHLRQVRHPAGQRRGDLRLRPHRATGSAARPWASSPT
jgi:hypothetical protein